MIKIRKATEEDLRRAIADAQGLYADFPNLLQGGLDGIENGRAWVMCDEFDRIGCLIGVYILWPGVASCWAITCNSLSSSYIGYTRRLKRFIQACENLYGTHRTEIYVKTTLLHAVRWAKVLGFEIESIMKQYGYDKTDYYMMRRLR